MKTLRVYGDSFVAPGSNNWPEQVSNKLGIAVDNKAVSGGSTEHAIKCFVRDIEQDIIKDGDIIIFVASTPGRLHFQFQNDRPETSSEYLRDPSNYSIDHKWYWENKNHIQWWMLNQDYDLMNLNHVAHMSLIKDIAYAKPECLFICLSNSHHKHDKISQTNPSNFLRSYTYLNQISIQEIVSVDSDSYDTWVAYTKFDARTNHLTNINLNTLATLIAEAIDKRDISNLTYDKFQQQFILPIKSKQQYIANCKDGLYTFNQWLFDQLR